VGLCAPQSLGGLHLCHNWSLNQAQGYAPHLRFLTGIPLPGL
jgi:hypothetical protein